MTEWVPRAAMSIQSVGQLGDECILYIHGERIDKYSTPEAARRAYEIIPSGPRLRWEIGRPWSPPALTVYDAWGVVIDLTGRDTARRAERLTLWTVDNELAGPNEVADE